VDLLPSTLTLNWDLLCSNIKAASQSKLHSHGPRFILRFDSLQPNPQPNLPNLLSPLNPPLPRKRKKPRSKGKKIKSKETEKEQKNLKEKEKAKAQKDSERQKAAALKEKERERVQKEKEREKQKREKEKEKEKLAKENQLKSKKKQKDENKPTRGRTAYTLYFSSEYPKIKEQHPNKTLTDIVKIASQKWNNLSANEKKPFEDEANKDKSRYQKEMEAYQKTLPPKRPLSSYIVFANEIRAGIQAENPEAPVYEIAKIIGAKWKTISNAEREKYKKQAEKLKGEYKKKLEKHQSNQ